MSIKMLSLEEMRSVSDRQIHITDTWLRNTVRPKLSRFPNAGDSVTITQQELPKEFPEEISMEELQFILRKEHFSISPSLPSLWSKLKKQEQPKKYIFSIESHDDED